MRTVNFDDGYTSASAPSADGPSSGISVTPTGNLSSDNAQDAFEELQGDIDTLNSGHVANTSNPHSVTKTQVGLSNVTNDAQIPLTQKGANSGVAELDSSGYLPLARIPVSLLGSVRYQGTWDADSNTPTLVSSIGTAGYYYVVNVAGATDLDSEIDWAVGDWVIFNGAFWEKVDHSDAVVSVNGYTGVVSLDISDLGGSMDFSDLTGDVDLPTQVTGTLAVANGGTGVTSSTGSGANVLGTSPSLGSPTISDYALLTESASPSTPAAGKLAVFAKTDKKLYTKNSDGTESQVGSGSGSGEKTYVTNPSGLNDAAAAVPTGWGNVGNLDIVVTKTAADLPREYTTASGFKVTADSNTQSVADYVYYDFTLDDVDLSKKLKIQWSQKMTGTYTAGQLAVVITTQADRTTAVATPVVTAIPAADGVFTTSFDASTTAALSLVIRATTDMTTNGGIVISDVIVGPGIQPQGAVVGPWISWTPTAPTGLGAGTGTSTGRYRRNGDSMEVRQRFTKDATPGSGTTQLVWTIPTGFTIDTSKLPGGTSTLATIGHGGQIGASFSPTNDLKYASATTVWIAKNGTGDFFKGSDATATSEWDLYYTIPVAEWTGSGTVNLAQNDVEYASNSSTSDADDTTSFAYGSGGSTFPGTLTTTKNKRVRFQTPIQADDQIVLEYSPDRISWRPLSGGGGTATLDISAFSVTVDAGAAIVAATVGATDVDVKFRRYTDGSSNWSTSGGYWRVRKASAGAAVGFGLATADSSGLVSSYEEYTHTSTFTWSGSGGNSGSITMDIVRIGKQVFITIPQVHATTGTGSTSLDTSASTVLPSRFRPVSKSPSAGCVATDNNTASTAAASCQVNTDGHIYFFKNGNATFTNAATGGLRHGTTISFKVP